MQLRTQVLADAVYGVVKPQVQVIMPHPVSYTEYGTFDEGVAQHLIERPVSEYVSRYTVVVGPVCSGKSTTSLFAELMYAKR